jgi:aerobic-type carbon monoxide dehydrogenase small subunit (CoxS/CutS family)
MTRRILLNVNGATCAVDTDPKTPLLWILSWVLREPFVPDRGEYGSSFRGGSTVRINGEPVRSCVVPVSAAENARIVTDRRSAARFDDDDRLVRDAAAPPSTLRFNTHE